MLRICIVALSTAALAAVSPLNKYDWVSQLMPVLISVIMVVIVRSIFDMNATKKPAWNYNLLVIALCSIFSAVFVHEYKMSAPIACLFGMGVGGMGIGIISFGKPVLLAVISKVSDGLKTPPAP